MKVPPPLRWLAGAAILGMSVMLFAQSPVRQSVDGVLRPFWKCNMQGGTYLVPLDRVSNVSTHEYVVQGAGRVWEMVVSDDSSTIARFYYMESASLLKDPIVTGESGLKYTEAALEKAAKATQTEEIWKRVVKEYPHATHAHTVEYRLEDIKTMHLLFDHLSDCWMHGRPGTINVGKPD